MDQILVSSSQDCIDLAMVVGRIFIGACFVMHALGKLGYVGPGGTMEGFSDWLKSLGMPFPKANAWAAMLSEMFGGILLTVGLATRPVCILLMFVMLIAGVFGHKGAGYLITNNPPGNEYTVNLGVILFVFLLIGPGRHSLDALLF